MKRSTRIIGAVLAAVLLVGIGEAAAFAASHLRPGSTVGSTRRVTAVSISLIDALGSQHPLPPVSRLITDAAVASKLYEDVLALPPFPKETMHCPADFGTDYGLDFKVGPNLLELAKVDASGCESVTMNGRTYWAGTNKGAAFWHLLGRTLHLAPAQLHRPARAYFTGAGRATVPSHTDLTVTVPAEVQWRGQMYLTKGWTHRTGRFLGRTSGSVSGARVYAIPGANPGREVALQVAKGEYVVAVAAHARRSISAGGIQNGGK